MEAVFLSTSFTSVDVVKDSLFVQLLKHRLGHQNVQYFNQFFPKMIQNSTNKGQYFFSFYSMFSEDIDGFERIAEFLYFNSIQFFFNDIFLNVYVFLTTSKYCGSGLKIDLVFVGVFVVVVILVLVIRPLFLSGLILLTYFV